ncbi:MAG: hypothetical protein FJ144_13545 [Deltaproteobacteria bacterium]|nr:hypothetical protein [Deltaproteobacteria bacterium]
MKVCARVVVALAVVFAFAAPARADVPCAADIAKLCKGVPPGGGRIQDCLKQHEAEVSAECKARVDELAKELQLAAAVCRWDIGRLCSGEHPGHGKLAACLKSHENDLSPACKKQLESLKAPPA